MTTSWSERFDELFTLAVKYKEDGYNIVDFDYLNEERDKIKSFIEAELAAARREVIEKTAERVEWMRKDILPSFPPGDLEGIADESRRLEKLVGYNEALNDVLTALSKLNQP